MNTTGEKIIQFYKKLIPPENLPESIEVLHPQQYPEVIKVVEIFFHKFYNDKNARHLLLGINPGRFGAGTTGINFTAPRQLTKYCGIEHSFKNQSELSAEFIYEMIERFGGVEKFYKVFFISSISPLGFTRQGKNLNYYDNKAIQATLNPFIIESLKKQLEFAKKDICFCVGGEKNFKFLITLNKEFNFFKEIIPLPHPRFIMQYRRKQKEKYIQEYLFAFQQI